MKYLDRRIERLEESLAPCCEQGVVVITNVNPQSAESACQVELSPGGPWAFAIRGGPFTEEELCGLRDEYAGGER
jgi:hypothetical protein